MATFTKDVDEIRRRATQKIEEGAVTDSYKLDKDRVVEILNEALATEIVCVLRYQHHYFMATGVHGRSVADLFKEHADEEREHADEIAERIQQLGGKPNFNPGDLVQRSVSQYIEGETLADMIREDLIAERMVIDVYQRMIEYFGAKDPTTRTLIEHIKAEEEDHASELSDMMFIVNPQTGEDEGADPGTDPLHESNRRGKGSSGNSRQQSSGTARSGFAAAHAQSREEEDEKRSERREGNSTSGWGNESNVGGRGKGGPARSTAPKETNWGNEGHVGTSSRRAQEGGMSTSNTDTKRNAETSGNSRHAGRGVDRSGNDKKNTNITNRKDERVTPKAPRGADLQGQTDKQKRQDSGNLPGVGGRTMNRRRNESLDIDTDDVAERANSGASSGSNKSPRVLQKNRKGGRRAA